MGQYVRVLSKQTEAISFQVLKKAMRAARPPVALTIESGSESKWEQLLLAHKDGTPITQIEHSLVTPESMAESEIEEFLEEIERERPKSALPWLKQFLKETRSIYVFQVLSGTEKSNGWDAFDELYSAIFWAAAPAIIQDDQAFSNEQGYDILWVCPIPEGETRKVGVWIEGRWVACEIDLANNKHCAAFRRGEIPAGMTPITGAA